MKIHSFHPWDISPSDAIQIQNKLKKHVSLTNDFKNIKKIAGVDVSYKNNRARAAVVVLRFPELELIYSQVNEGEIHFPYVPGLLSFREIPLMLPLLEKMKVPPDLIITDGQGIAHPRQMGLASHLGVVTNIPTIGCAKSKLFGTYKNPSETKGSYSFLFNKKDIIGAVVRTRTNVAPVFISPGHKISLKTAINHILKCCPKYRLPEPIRSAHKLTR